MGTLYLSPSDMDLQMKYYTNHNLKMEQRAKAHWFGAKYSPQPIHLQERLIYDTIDPSDDLLKLVQELIDENRPKDS